MKNFSFKFITLNFILLYCLAFFACAGNDISWDGTNVIINGKKCKVDVDLQAIEKKFVFDNTLYLVGYQIDLSGINTPAVAWFVNNNTTPYYEKFDEDIQNIFPYQNKIFLLDSSGAVYENSKHGWIKSSIIMKPGSHVIFSDNDLIACRPSPIFKDSKEKGMCYSVNNNWSVEINWREILPDVCNSNLIVIGEQNNKKTAWKIDISNGNKLQVKEISSKIQNPCNVHFDSAAANPY